MRHSLFLIILLWQYQISFFIHITIVKVKNVENIKLVCYSFVLSEKNKQNNPCNECQTSQCVENSANHTLWLWFEDDFYIKLF